MKIYETHELINAISEDLKQEKKFKNLTDIELYHIATNVYKLNLLDKIEDALLEIYKSI
jgi:hypothetical protein